MINVKVEREKLGISQEELARELGVSLNTLWSWENNRRQPTGLYKKALEEYFSEKAADTDTPTK